MPPDFDTVRNDLRKKTVYLADGGDALDALMWYKTKAFDRVVTRDAAEDYDKEYADYSQSQGSSAPLDTPPAPPPATLSAIVRLSNYKYFMTACSDWHPDFSEIILPLKDVRPSAIAEDPCLAAITGDFEAAWGAIDELIRGIVPGEKDVMQSLGVIDRAKRPYFGFKVGHKVFEKIQKPVEIPRPEAEELSNDEDLDAKLDPEFAIEGWPLTNPEAHIHLDKLSATHRANPIPAYNLAGHLIRPSQYAAELKGAVVRLEFNLNHWFINSRHVFTADITRIRVLLPPPPFDTPTPKRKRVSKVDDFYTDDDDDMDRMPPTPTKRAKHRADPPKNYELKVLSSVKKV